MSLKVVCVLFVLLVAHAEGQFYLSPRSRLAWRAASTCAKQANVPFGPPHGRIFAAQNSMSTGPGVVTVSFSIRYPGPWRFCVAEVPFPIPMIPFPCAPLKCLP